ncbi:MAG: D-aminoacylase [Hydrotalea flava]|uniref:N-acyl-D-amino-acid deacylase family protein n=1 Tax=Hydrotalea TaxID=1004300 RepID=UPI000941EC6E|nr:MULTISPECIES: D-aminoacylase [Hydrotalea]MBY0348947.1 D-aminoacylase [Hydrotalea flava]RWZ86415.1 MAG: D-aminoacylase [Hydrotalea sp. AMD]
MRKLIWLFIVLFPVALTAQTADILIKNGKIINGTGNNWFYGDVAVVNNKIAAVGNLSAWKSAKVIDAAGMIVAPGFIDVHTHIEGDEVRNPTADNFIYDGVTTVITGNCGLSKVDIGNYFKWLDSLHLSINIASLVGHNDIRKAVMGTARRAPTEAEMLQMEAITRKAMQDGAVGLSTGLIYIPGTYAATDEVVALTKIAAAYHGVYATHMRDEGDSVVQAIQEALHIGTVAGLPVEISHFKLSGQQNWRRSKETLALIIDARKKGIDVTIDQYPYTASSTNLGTLLPDWVLADGKDSINARLNNPVIREQVIAYMLQRLSKRKLKHFSYPVVANYAFDTAFNGKSIETINLLKGRKHTAKAEAETVLEMMQHGGAGMVFHGMSETDVQYIMQYPFCMFGCDAGIRVFGEGVPHPRGYGSNAKILGKYVREEHLFSLEQAIRRMTSLPAQKFHLQNRGLLLPGYAADIVVFNPDTVTDKATYEKPHQYSEGFKYVVVNGTITLKNGQHTGARNGITLKNSASF